MTRPPASSAGGQRNVFGAVPNPLQDADFLPEHNTRDIVVTQVDFEKLFACAEAGDRTQDRA
jgi:hypothetical protein